MIILSVCNEHVLCTYSGLYRGIKSVIVGRLEKFLQEQILAILRFYLRRNRTVT